MFTYKNRQLYCENVPIETIVKHVDTPVYIYSKNKIIQNVRAYDRAFDGIAHVVCFAMKANSNLSVCRTVFSAGAGADVVSGGELHKALRAGVDPGKVVFAGIGKSADEIHYAIRSKILLFNCESVEEIKLISAIAKGMNAKPRIALRVNPNIDAHTHKLITTGINENKFGIPYSRAVNAFRFARDCGNLVVSGIHCHIGSQITLTAPFIQIVKKISVLFATLTKIGFTINYVDIGGGLGIRYRKENPPSPSDIAKKVIPVLKPLGITLIVEPGRYIIGNAGILATKVLYNKTGEHKNFVVIDAAMNDLMRPVLYEAYHEISPVVLHKNRKMITEDVVGPICESGDFVAKNRLLPVRLSGEHIAIMCAGAYGFSMSSQYNSRPRAAEVMVDGSKWKIIRKRETYSDLTAKEI